MRQSPEVEQRISHVAAADVVLVADAVVSLLITVLLLLRLFLSWLLLGLVLLL